MAKVKFNTSFFDKKDGVRYEPSDKAVEVPKHVEDRIKEIQKNDKRHSKSFEFIVSKPQAKKKDD